MSDLDLKVCAVKSITLSLLPHSQNVTLNQYLLMVIAMRNSTCPRAFETLNNVR